MALKFYPAKHNRFFIWFWQNMNAWELRTKLKLNILPEEIEKLRSSSSGLILVANHSDELDPRICMEISRLSKRRFTFMANSEIYKEWFGIARWCLQYIGAFSVERGAADQQARRAAIDTLRNTNNVLVIFPEGEIYNLNDCVQPFKTGAIHIGLEALQELRSLNSSRTVAVLPVAIKYYYQNDIAISLRKRIIKMEKHLSMNVHPSGIRDELYSIMNQLNPGLDSRTADELVIRLQKARETIVNEIEEKYIKTVNIQGDLLSRAQKMAFFLRKQITEKKFFTKETQKQLEEDLKAIRNTIQMATWQPSYIELNPSQERLAETVIKLERVVFNIKRPRFFGKRKAYIRLLDFVDLHPGLAAYDKDPDSTAELIAEELRTQIQEAIISINKTHMD